MESDQRNHYEVLGYERPHLKIDLADLEKRYFELSKKYHPDRFATRSAAEIEAAHEQSSALNNAYRTLKDPLSRAKYMVELELGSIEEKSASVPPEMADLFFEVHESLDAISDSDGNPPEFAVKEVEKAEYELKSQVKNYQSILLEKFDEYDGNPDRKILEEIKEILSHRSYIQSFLRQIDSVFMSRELRRREF